MLDVPEADTDDARLVKDDKEEADTLEAKTVDCKPVCEMPGLVAVDKETDV